MTDEFVREIDAALRPSGYSDRSKFVRDAVYERLKALGYKLPKEITLAPGRLRKLAVVEDRGVPQSEARPVGHAHYGAARFDGMELNEDARKSEAVEKAARLSLELRAAKALAKKKEKE